MIAAAVVAAGAAYASGLWCVALAVAKRRRLDLGRYPWWLAAGCGVGAALVWSAVEPRAAVLAAATLIGGLVCALVDARTGFIFDALTLTMTAVAAASALAAGRFADGSLAVAVTGTMLGGLYLVTQRRGIGLGDVKLGCSIALGLGAGAAVVTVGTAFVFGALYGAALVGAGRARRTDAIRFGPFLAAGAVVAFAASDAGWLG